MDRGVLLRGKYLLESWEDLEEQDLIDWISDYYPVAFDNLRGGFTAFPEHHESLNDIIEPEPRPTAEYQDSDLSFSVAFHVSTDRALELYYGVRAADAYLRGKRFHLKSEKSQDWAIRIKQARTTVAEWHKRINLTPQLHCDSPEHKQWMNAINNIQVSRHIRLRLTVLLKRLAGEKISVILADNELKSRNINRDICDAEERDIAAMRKICPDLPDLPKYIKQNG